MSHIIITNNEKAYNVSLTTTTDGVTATISERNLHAVGTQVQNLTKLY